MGLDFVSRFEWSKKIANIFGLNKDLIIPIHSSELKLSAKRPNVNLSNKKLFSKYGIKMISIDDGLQSMKKVNY